MKVRLVPMVDGARGTVVYDVEVNHEDEVGGVGGNGS